MSNLTPSQYTYYGNTGPLMSLLSTSVVFWLLIGAMAYSDVLTEDVDAHIILNIFLTFVLVLSLIIANSELPTARQSRRAYRGSAYYTASITGFGASTVYVLMSSNWDSGHQRLFWALGGIHGGILLEATTGFYSFFARRLRESVYESEAENRVSETKASKPQASEPQAAEPQVSEPRSSEPVKQD